MRSERHTWEWTVGLGVTVAALLWFVDPAGAIPLESWDDKIPSAGTRFMVLTEFGGAAVLDKETQLVWERAPLASLDDWDIARLQCTNRETGRRKGWRLPSVHELASLVDPANSNPALPTGHPFTINPNGWYWSASSDANNPPVAALYVAFPDGSVHDINKDSPIAYAWCVRGSNNADKY